MHNRNILAIFQDKERVHLLKVPGRVLEGTIRENLDTVLLE